MISIRWPEIISVGLFRPLHSADVSIRAFLFISLGGLVVEYLPEHPYLKTKILLLSLIKTVLGKWAS